MNLLISENRTISDIQKEFNSYFPFLKIEFSRHSMTNLSYEMYDRKKTIDPKKKISEVIKYHASGQIIIDNNMSVMHLEKRFREAFNLIVHVLRKSGNAWLQCTTTSNWSLDEQNNHGETLSSI